MELIPSDQAEKKITGAGELSGWSVAAVLLRNRWRIVIWAILGGLFAAIMVFDRPLIYSSSVSFLTRATEGRQPGIADLAGRIGVNLSSGDASQSPELYVTLLKSRALLEPLITREFRVHPGGTETQSIIELFGVEGDTPGELRENAVSELRERITASVDPATGMVRFSVRTRWPLVSAALAESLLSGIEDFNQSNRRSQARAEREFSESRMQVVGRELEQAEDEVSRFLKSNRNFRGSPELTHRFERLQRAVQIHQQLYTSLAQAFEEARMREVRDLPLITVVEAPQVPSKPEPRGRFKAGVLGLLSGGLLGVLAALLSDGVRRYVNWNDPAASEFRAAATEFRSETRAAFQWWRRRGHDH